jgi:Na+-driven multidrug efflux pump
MFYKIMGIIGIAQLAATQVVFAIAHASFLPAVGVGQACATLVGKYLGKEDVNKAAQSMVEGLRGSFMIMGTMGLVFIFFPNQIVPIFTNDPEIINLGIQILPWVGAIQFIDVFAITLWFALSGAGDTRFTAYLGMIASWCIFVPFSYLLGIKLNFGLAGPWIAFALYLFVETILIIFRVWQGKWKHMEV